MGREDRRLSADPTCDALRYPIIAIAAMVPLQHTQVNVLAYFESLCADAEAANMLINSSLAVLLVHMLRNGRQPALRARQATVLGLLLRHATTIVDELYSTSARGGARNHPHHAVVRRLGCTAA